MYHLKLALCELVLLITVTCDLWAYKTSSLSTGSELVHFLAFLSNCARSTENVGGPIITTAAFDIELLSDNSSSSSTQKELQMALCKERVKERINVPPVGVTVVCFSVKRVFSE